MCSICSDSVFCEYVVNDFSLLIVSFFLVFVSIVQLLFGVLPQVWHS